MQQKKTQESSSPSKTEFFLGLIGVLNGALFFRFLDILNILQLTRSSTLPFLNQPLTILQTGLLVVTVFLLFNNLGAVGMILSGQAEASIAHNKKLLNSSLAALVLMLVLNIVQAL